MQARAAKDAQAGKKPASDKLGKVERVNKQAERIAERAARGEKAPSLFGSD